MRSFPTKILCSFVLFASGLAAAQVSSSRPLGALTQSDGNAAALFSGTGLMASDGSVDIDSSLDASAATGGPVGHLEGCVYNSGGSQFQAVKFKMKRAATVRLDALLYHGASCDPGQFFDEFGFGNKVSLGKGTWIFWFIHFPDMLNTSGHWKVGKQKSQCVDYQTAPDC